jgi:pimeloyl-ACP methyl ester carboxylesterase
VNPDPHKLRIMFERDVERMKNFVETSDDDVRSIAVPTLIVAGDRDVPKPEHAVELARLMPRARLMILPGAHGEFLGEAIGAKENSRHPELSAALIEDFLDSPE